MGKPVAGDVMVLPLLPQSNLQSGKRRPALAVADLPGEGLILCQITSQIRSDGFSIPLTQGDFRSGRLMQDSYIRSQRLFTVEKNVILYTGGQVNATTLEEAKTHLRQLLA